jgi:hypothetical protein
MFIVTVVYRSYAYRSYVYRTYRCPDGTVAYTIVWTKFGCSLDRGPRAHFVVDDVVIFRGRDHNLLTNGCVYFQCAYVTRYGSIIPMRCEKDVQTEWMFLHTQLTYSQQKPSFRLQAG